MGLFSRIFGGGESKRSDAPMTPQMAEKIIRDYGVILQTEAPTPGCVRDVSKLAYPKEKIKEALIIGLRSTSDSQMKEMIKVGYIQLADWQEGVGDTDLGLDLLKMNGDDDPTKLAESILKQSAGYEKWAPIVHPERKALQQELEDMGL